MPSETDSWASSPAGRGPVVPWDGGPAFQVLDNPEGMRRAGRDLLSLALIDSRNRLLRLLALDESPAALRTVARAAWYQEFWIARHVQRVRGEACDRRAPRLAGIEPRAESWIAESAGSRTDGQAPPPEALRAYLAETLETTLDLLTTAPEDDAGLYCWRNSLLHEDRLTEALAERLLLDEAPSRADAPPLWWPARRWLLGSQPGGLVPHGERWAHEVDVPAFEIDARPVNWARYVEFVDDGGYDRRELWTDAGWAWLQLHGRRAPRHVEQLRGGVLVLRRGGLRQVPAIQPVTHVTRHEADAWCRWAGRRLPTEPEWEVAAASGRSRGFAWGDVFEWVAGSARAWPGAGPPAPGSLDAVPPSGSHGVLRGASWATRPRWRHPKARRFQHFEQDTAYCGFRSCAL